MRRVSGKVSGARKRRPIGSTIIVPPVPPPAATGKYRYESTYLFQTAPIEDEPVRHPSGGSVYDRGKYAPGARKVDLENQWEATHGDYIDGTGTRFGTSPALSSLINSGSEFTYTLNATAIVQQAQVGNRWLAMKWDMSPITTRRIYGAMSANPPRIEVVYADTTEATLACRITGLSNTSTSFTSFDDTDYSLSPAILVEFERPSQAVTSANLIFRVSTSSGTSTTFRAWLLDPRVNASPVETGIAYTEALDAGLITHSDIIVAHRYVDTEDIDNFRVEGVLEEDLQNTSGEINFDPAIWGTGATDLTKYPHTMITAPTANSTGHRWTTLPVDPVDEFGTDSSTAFQIELVPSTYTLNGFEPLVAGMGALKWKMQKCLDVDGNVISDGSFVGPNGTGMESSIYFSEEDFGNLQRVFTRHYFRLGTEDGGDYTDTIDTRYHVHQSESGAGAAQEIVWTDKGGKFGLVPSAHAHNIGGFSGSSGGVHGWQARNSWTSVDENEGGPLEGGWVMGFHSFDQQQNPEGNYARNYNYGAQVGATGYLGYGGMNVLYAHKWYCLESEHYLNTVLPYYPGFLDDGYIKFWVDGRHILTKKNWVFRQKPIWRGLNMGIHSTALNITHSSSIVVSGFSDGEGYVGAVVRSNRLDSSSTQAYGLIVSRFSATQAVIGLVKKDSTNNSWLHLAMTDPIDAEDGDTWTLEATGAQPTVLTCKQNGVSLTLKWYTGATDFAIPTGDPTDPNAFPNPASTALQTATSYSDSLDSNLGKTLHTNPYVGIFAQNTSTTNGLRIDSWSATDGTTNLSDSFAYSDADLSTANSVWKDCDSRGRICPLVVISGSVYPAAIHRQDKVNSNLACRELGPKQLMYNWFHGGQTRNAETRVMFITGVAAATSYIGPMNTGESEVSLPSYVPTTEGAVAELTVANGGLTNNFVEVCAPYYQESLFWNVRNGDSGPTLNKYWGDYGGYVIHGAGHSSTNDNTAVILEFGEDACTFKRLTKPTAFFGEGTDETTQQNNSKSAEVERDGALGEYPFDGQPMATHTYGTGDVIGPEYGGAAMGTYITVIRPAEGDLGVMASQAPHKLDMDNTTGIAGDYVWENFPGFTGGGEIAIQSPQPAYTAFVPAQNRVYIEARWATAARRPRWYDIATNAYINGTGTARLNNTSYTWGGRLLHIPERDILLFAWATNSSQVIAIRYMSVAAGDTNPSWNNTIRTLSQTLLGPNGWSHICWCPVTERLLLGAITADPANETTFDTVYEIEIPTDLNTTWPVTAKPIANGGTLRIPTQTIAATRGAPTYKGWDYNPNTRCVMYWPDANFPTSNQPVKSYNDTVYLYRPEGT